MDELDNEAQAKRELDLEFFRKTATLACTRLPLLNKLGRAARLERFVEAYAWTDAMLALIELELPAWKMCRQLYDDGEWICSLSRHPNLALVFGDGVEGIHESPPLAMLLAFLNARRSSLSHVQPTRTVPEAGNATEPMLCCDNFK
jgi:hypothetical protein